MLTFMLNLFRIRPINQAHTTQSPYSPKAQKKPKPESFS